MTGVETEEEGGAVVWVCRDLPGEHAGGPDCFCCPVAFDPNDEASYQGVLRMLENGLLGPEGVN